MQKLQQPRRPLVFELVRIHSIQPNEESLLDKLMQQENHSVQPSNCRAPQHSIQPYPPRHPQHQPKYSTDTNSHHIMQHGHHSAKALQQHEMHMNTGNYAAPSLQQDHSRIQRPSTISDEVVDLTVTEENGAGADPRIEPESQQTQQRSSASSHQQHQISPEPNCAVGGSASDGSDQLADPVDLLGEAALNCDISEALKLLIEDSDQQLQEGVEPNHGFESTRDISASTVQYAHAAKMPNNCCDNASGGISEQQSKTTEQQVRVTHGLEDTDKMLAPTILNSQVSETANGGNVGTPDQPTNTTEALPDAMSGDQSKTVDQQATPKTLAHEALAVVVLDVAVEAKVKATNEGKSPPAINMAVKMATVEAGRAAVGRNSIASSSCNSNIKKNAEEHFSKAHAKGCPKALETALQAAVAEVKAAGGYRSWFLAKAVQAREETRAAKAKEQSEAAKAESTAERGALPAPSLDNHVEHTAREEKAEPIPTSFDDTQDSGRGSGAPLPEPAGQQPLLECCDDSTTADKEISGVDKTTRDGSVVPENVGMASDTQGSSSAASASDNDNAGEENTSNFDEKDAPNSVSDKVSAPNSVSDKVSEGVLVPSSTATESENHNDDDQGAPNSLIDSEALQTDATAHLSSDSPDNGSLNINETTRSSPSEPTTEQPLQPPPSPDDDPQPSKEQYEGDIQRETKDPSGSFEGISPFHECVISKTPPVAASSIVGRYTIGSKVSKIFMDDEAGKFRPFSGEIKSYDHEEGLYRVCACETRHLIKICVAIGLLIMCIFVSLLNFQIVYGTFRFVSLIAVSK